MVYSAAALLDKNRDYVVAEHAALLGASALPLVAQLFDAEAAAAAGTAAADTIAAASASELPSPRRNGRTSAGVVEKENGGTAAPPPPSGPSIKSGFRFSSVGARFRRQLGGLMATLAACQPHYIRCIKPNEAGAPGAMDPGYVLDQARAAASSG